MQSWPQGQNGDGNSSWQDNYSFTNQNGQFDQGQTWHQPITDHQTAYSRQLNPSDPAASFLPDPNTMLPGYHNAPASTFDLAQQYQGQDVLDPTFNNLRGDVYAHPSKMDLSGGSLHQMPQLHGHPHTQTHTQSFSSHHNYGSFEPQPQAEQSYNSNASQYPQSQLMPQDIRQHDHTPVQQHFTNIQPNFNQGQLRPGQTPPLQHQHQTFDHNAAFGGSHLNGQAQQQYQHHQTTSRDSNYHQPSPTSYPEQAYKSFEYQQQAKELSNQPYTVATQQGMGARHAPPPKTAPPLQDEAVQQTPAGYETQLLPPMEEGPSKKRQRVAGAVAASPVPDAIIPAIHSPVDLSNRRLEEVDALVAPTPTQEETQKLQQFQKRGKAAQAKFPSIKGMPHLAHEGTIKLPAPKSYDKLAPLVAIPSRSNKPIVPEAGHELPCEVQGRFTSHYRPAYDKSGLDERRMEAKPLLDEFDASMKALGKRRPKYTEYPHSFKEQLKSDEAVKNKAGKKAKKEQEEDRKPIRSLTRPTDPVEAAAWDAIGIVNIDPSIAKTSALVAGRVQQAGDFFIKLRGEMNQAKQELDQALRESRPEPEIASLRQEEEVKKATLHRALDAIIEHADDAVMDNLGGHQKLVLSLINVLISCIKATDFSGKLPKIVLELFTHFQMTKKIAETTNFDTVRKRFADKGDEEVKELVRDISASVKKMLKTSESETSTGYTGTSAASRAKTAAVKSTTATSAKRGRDDDASADGRTVKKMAVEAGGGSLSKKLAQPKIQLQSASKTTAAKAAASSVLGDKGRSIPKTPARPEPVSSADSPSASSEEKAKSDIKKPVVKTKAAKIAPSKPEAKPPVPKMGAAPTSSALSGIASLLDSINTGPRAKTPPPALKEASDSDTPETEAEKSKRLRKEARRKLRVSWKPEQELVQIKIFEKEDEEDEGRDLNMIRDAADDKSEGMVLKQRANVEEEEDDDDVPYQPWLAPVALDFSPLHEATRSKNYVTRGGSVEFSTDEQKSIAQREQRELMAIYSTLDDIPSTPKSPQPESPVSQDTKVYEVPNEGTKFKEIHVRWAEVQQMGVDNALYSAAHRFNAKHNPSSSLDSIFGRPQTMSAQSQPAATQQSHSAGATVVVDDVNVPLAAGAPAAEQVLAWLRSDQAKLWRDPNPLQVDPARTHRYSDAPTQAAAELVEPISRELAGLPYPATEPPAWIAQDEERAREWWQVYNKEYAARQKRVEEERARAAAATPASHGQGSAQDWLAYYAQLQQHQQQQSQPRQQGSYDPYMAILQQINGGQSQGNQQQSNTGAGQGSHVPDDQLQSLLAAMGQTGQQQQQPNQTQAQSHAGYHPNDPSYQQMLMLAQMAQKGQQSQAVGGGGEHDRGRDRDDNWNRYDDSDDYDRQHDDHRRDQYDRGHRDRDRDKLKKKPGPSTIHKPPNAALIGTKPCTFWQQGKCARGDKCTFRHD